MHSAALVLLGCLVAGCHSVPTRNEADFPLREIPTGRGMQIDLKYKTGKNLTGRPLYPKNFKAFAHPELVADLRKVVDYLNQKGYGLLVLDAWRPPVASALLWNEAVAQDLRHIYAPPGLSGHTKGTSIDVTLYSLSGSSQVVMPSDFDCALGGRGRTPHSELLGAAMRRAGFRGHPLEWWHFDHPSGKFSAMVDNPWETSGYRYKDGKLFKRGVGTDWLPTFSR